MWLNALKYFFHKNIILTVSLYMNTVLNSPKLILFLFKYT